MLCVVRAGSLDAKFAADDGGGNGKSGDLAQSAYGQGAVEMTVTVDRTEDNHCRGLRGATICQHFRRYARAEVGHAIPVLFEHELDENEIPRVRIRGCARQDRLKRAVGSTRRPRFCLHRSALPGNLEGGRSFNMLIVLRPPAEAEQSYWGRAGLDKGTIAMNHAQIMRIHDDAIRRQWRDEALGRTMVFDCGWCAVEQAAPLL